MSEYDPREPFAMIPGGGCCHTGATMLDWFAGQALAGYFAAPHTQHRGAANSETAEYCYAMAHAMMTARAASDQTKEKK